MDNKIRSAYECLFIVDTADSEQVKSTLNKFLGLIADNGETLDVADWGKRRLEYPINDKNEGYYEIVTFRADPEFPAELERLLNIDETVMRSLILKLEEDVVEKVLRRAADKAAAAANAEENKTEEAAPVEEAAPEQEAAPADAE